MIIKMLGGRGEPSADLELDGDAAFPSSGPSSPNPVAVPQKDTVVMAKAIAAATDIHNLIPLDRIPGTRVGFNAPCFLGA